MGPGAVLETAINDPPPHQVVENLEAQRGGGGGKHIDGRFVVTIDSTKFKFFSYDMI